MREQTDYVGNMIYENNALKRILVDGGYVEDGNYYFYETDHLGNNRVVMNDAGLLVQTNDYYPYGMSFAEGLERSKQPYKYNGKEFDAERGLNLLSHELKHAYQFETGSFSSGKRTDGAPFYDKHDELEAYQRGELFGGPHVHSINSLPPLYNQFQDGPVDYKSFNKVILSSPKALQNIANSTKSNFRVNGVTYKYQER
jgi:hypothetical protein